MLRKRLICVRLGQEGLRARVHRVDTWTNRVLTRGVGWAYKRGPRGGGRMVGRYGGGMLFEIVEKREGMRGRRPRVAICSRICERLEALDEDPPAGGSGINVRV